MSKQNNFHGINPSDHGWQHTGSNAQSRVEFYQRDGVKMDYYPTTGTIKTSMDHPTAGPTQMFRRDLSDHDAARVFDNPRAHTDVGYQRRENCPNYPKKR